MGATSAVSALDHFKDSFNKVRKGCAAIGAMVDRRLEFGLLGPLEMRVDGALVASGTPKQRAVLAMLLMNRNSPVGVDRLITALWEGWPPGARASIHSYVSNLRKLLTGVGIDPREMLAAAKDQAGQIVDKIVERINNQ